LNTQPIVLDQAGRALIWGVGQYRQVVEDQFGNVQWDRVTSAGVTVPVPGEVTGDLNVTGNAIVGGSISAQNANISGVTTTQELSVGDQIHTTSLIATGFVQAGTVDSGDLNVVGTTGLTGPLNVQGDYTGNGNININDPQGKRMNIYSGDSPCYSMHNTVDSTNYGMWAAGNVIAFGQTDGAGNPLTPYVRINAAEETLFGSNIYPLTPGGANCGTVGNPWNAVVAHAFVTASTDASSEEVREGMLGLVASIPVKTLPHMGIAEGDLGGLEEAKMEGGVNYNVLVGVLWQALKELSSKFDAYVVAHP